MDIVQVLRQIGTVVLLPIYILIGIVVSEIASTYTGIWIYYYSAIFIPAIGLLCTWIVAPFYKTYNLLFVYSIGVALAYFLSVPAHYPENHPLAYTMTYMPFLVTVLWGAILCGTLIFYGLHKDIP
jgi:lysylphosphatidylglycerol synthetase-like protein (DUF2156 family)